MRSSHQAPNQPRAAIPPDAVLSELEDTALELARVAGAEIASALGRTLALRYKKSAEGAPPFRDPVSEVDHKVEVLIRARLADQLPEHEIIGEEIEEEQRREHDFVWAIDPIDGTTNFVNGFPLFAASIGVLHQGRPLVGAVWCSTSHALRAGVYHARAGGNLCFEGEPLVLEANEAVRRHLPESPGRARMAACPGTCARPVRQRSNAPSSPQGFSASPVSRNQTSGTSPVAQRWSGRQAARCAPGRRRAGLRSSVSR